MQEMRRVALVGRPNVGKSRLFNRLVGKRISIVHDQPGVTRDIVSADVDGHFLLMDTGGLGMTEDMSEQVITDAVEDQVDFAIQAADIIIFVADGQAGYLPMDEVLLAKLRDYGKTLLVAVNKIDLQKHESLLNDFYRLGDVIAISAEHGHGIDALLTKIENHIGPKPEAQEEEEESRARICFSGRPNVGKSSLANALLNDRRFIVSEVPGTTRDAVAVNVDYAPAGSEPMAFSLIDTAGLKLRRKVSTSLDYFSTLRTEAAISDSDVIFLVLDARDGVTKLDKKLAGEIVKAGKGIIIVVNKWDFALDLFAKEQVDGYDTEEDFKEGFEKAVRKELFFLPHSPVLFTSAKEGYQIDTLLKTAAEVYHRLQLKLPTSQVNTVIGDLMEHRAPSTHHGKRFKIYYAVQVSANPHRFKIFCNQAVHLEAPYERYLASGFNKAFQLKGCPVAFELIGKPLRKRKK